MSAARLLAIALVVPLLAGCGGSNDYCDAVRAHQSEVGSIADTASPTGALRLLPVLEELETKAPGDVKDDYDLVISRIHDLQEALSSAGVDPSSYDPAHPPAGTSRADRRLISNAAAELAAADTKQALSSIEQEVLDVCHTPLGA